MNKFVKINLSLLSLFLTSICFGLDKPANLENYSGRDLLHACQAGDGKACVAVQAIAMGILRELCAEKEINKKACAFADEALDAVLFSKRADKK